MSRYPCESKLIIHPNLENRTLSLTLFHRHNAQYNDISLSIDVKCFIDANLWLIPSGLKQRIRQNHTLGYEKAVPQRIYYHWQKANSSTWTLDKDPITSVNKFLVSDNLADRFQSKVYETGDIRAIAIYINESISALRHAKELAMDATYGTNSFGMELYAVLAELDGTGVPLAYMFVKKKERVDGRTASTRAGDGGMTTILNRFLYHLKVSGLHPNFFGSDKDHSKINAIATTWEGVKIQLCYWHALRDIRMKLKSSKAADDLSHYHPFECTDGIDNFEAC